MRLQERECTLLREQAIPCTYLCIECGIAISYGGAPRVVGIAVTVPADSFEAREVGIDLAAVGDGLLVMHRECVRTAAPFAPSDRRAWNAPCPRAHLIAQGGPALGAVGFQLSGAAAGHAGRIEH